MKQIITTKGTFGFVEIPSDAHGFEIKHKHEVLQLPPNFEPTTFDDRCFLEVYYKSDNLQKKLGTPFNFFAFYPFADKAMPIDSCSIICTTEEVTEEEAKCVVDDCPIYAKCWKKYTYNGDTFIGGRFNSAYSCWTAVESLQSLLEANGLDITKNYVVLQVIEPLEKDDMLSRMKNYFATTPKEQILAEWEETKEWDNVGPTIEEFLQSNFEIERDLNDHLDMTKQDIKDIEQK